MKYLGWFFLLLTSCVSVEDAQMERLFSSNEMREKIYRYEEEIEFPLLPPQQKMREPYPWEGVEEKVIRPITAEHFFCRGSKRHRDRVIVHSGQLESIYADCAGGKEHKQEEIKPIVLTLLNRIQEVTGREVVVTSGFRCLKHQQYLHPGESNISSLYLVGAACDFYVRGLENAPQTVIKIIQDFYKEDKETAHDPSFSTFHRLSLERSHVITPWVNREICLIVNTGQEGRNPDNAHNYPYISLLVHYDRNSKRPIETRWEELFPK